MGRHPDQENVKFVKQIHKNKSHDRETLQKYKAVADLDLQKGRPKLSIYQDFKIPVFVTLVKPHVY